MADIPAIGPNIPGSINASVAASDIARHVRVPTIQLIAAIAERLGVTRADLTAALAQGAALSDVASRVGVTRADLIEMLRRVLLLSTASRSAVWTPQSLERVLAGLADTPYLQRYAWVDANLGWLVAAQVRQDTARQEPQQRRKTRRDLREEQRNSAHEPPSDDDSDGDNPPHRLDVRG